VSSCKRELDSTLSTLFHGRNLIFTFLKLMKGWLSQPHTSQRTVQPLWTEAALSWITCKHSQS